MRQDSSTALTTIPRTNAGIFFMRAAAASSHAIVAGDSGPYLDRGASREPRDGRAAAEGEKGGPGERPGGVGAEGIFGHQIAGHPVGPGAAAPAVAVHLARPASPPERGAAANVGEQLR